MIESRDMMIKTLLRFILQMVLHETWPLGAPQKGEATVTIGWPAKFRKRESDTELEFAAFPMVGQFVDSVRDTWFNILFERQHWVSSDFDPTNPVILEKGFEGMSGSPVFALHRSEVNPLQLIGVVRTYGTEFDILYCARADLIQADGTIATARPS